MSTESTFTQARASELRLRLLGVIGDVCAVSEAMAWLAVYDRFGPMPGFPEPVSDRFEEGIELVDDAIAGLQSVREAILSLSQAAAKREEEAKP